MTIEDVMIKKLGRVAAPEGLSWEVIVVGDVWRVLVVDDEPDVHAVTEIALRRMVWKGKSIELVNAFSGLEARAILEDPECPPINVVLVDVVMETDTAGLELCQFIRDKGSRATRVILRTGQPGVAPELTVLAEYDIDFYLSKIDATPDRLFAVLRSCLRCSADILELEQQIQMSGYA